MYENDAMGLKRMISDYPPQKPLPYQPQLLARVSLLLDSRNVRKLLLGYYTVWSKQHKALMLESSKDRMASFSIIACPSYIHEGQQVCGVVNASLVR